MASFFVRNNTSGSSFKSISGAVSRKEASDFNRLSNQFDDRCCRSAKTCVALEWKLLCFYYMCQFFVVLYNTRKFYLKILLRYGQRRFGKKKNNEKAAIKSHKRASQTGNCGSVLVCNVNKGTLELKKRHWKLSLHQILQVVCFSGFMENFVDAESKFSSHLTKLFLARATARADLWTR